jgi:hypothetical protein
MSQEDQESFIRWQDVTRNHFSSVTNFILTLATGLLAFQSMFLLESKFFSCGALMFASASLIILAVSVTLGLLCSVNRLRDFRLTTKIARRRNGETDLQDLQEKSKALGKFTWRLFWVQIALFGLGACCVAVAVFIQVWPAIVCYA